MPDEPRAAGDSLPERAEIIEVRVAELKQLFNAIDPSPFREKDLDGAAEEFIVGWAREAPRDADLALLVYLDRSAGLADEATVLRDAVRAFFRHRSEASSRRLRQLFRLGRTSLLIGLAFLAASFLAGDAIAEALRGHRLGEVVQEGLLIGGWVAMWKPMEIFLYEWWPIRAETKLLDRLSAMPVRIAYMQDAHSEAWRRDWPAVSPAATPAAG